MHKCKFIFKYSLLFLQPNTNSHKYDSLLTHNDDNDDDDQIPYAMLTMQFMHKD